MVILKNGDHITGEVKRLERGKLRFKTDSMGTVEIEWNDIAEVTSKDRFEVEDETGEKYYGALSPTEQADTVEVRGQEAVTDLPHPEVVRITPIKSTFWGRLDGSLNLGFSFTQANDSTQLNFDGDASYRTRNHLSKLSWSSITDDRNDGDSINRQDLTWTRTRYRRHRWFNVWLAQAQSNEELGLDLRLLAGGGAGRYFLQTNENLFQASLGLAASRENSADVASDQTSLEALLSAQFQKFIFDDPETDITTTLTLFPSLTESGRVRAELNVRLKREVVEDFFWNLSLLHSFDNQPTVEGAEKNDIAVTTSLGWSF